MMSIKMTKIRLYFLPIISFPETEILRSKYNYRKLLEVILSYKYIHEVKHNMNDTKSYSAVNSSKFYINENSNYYKYNFFKLKPAA